MAKVTFILGLCGSGKTYLAEQLKNETGAEVFENLLSDGSRLPALVECLRDGKDCVVDEVRFCLPAYRNEIVQHLSRIIGLKMRCICSRMIWKAQTGMSSIGKIKATRKAIRK